MPSKTWGTSQVIKDYVIVGDNDEIPTGQKAFVFNQSQNEKDKINVDVWTNFMAGNLTEIKTKIEMDIPNSKVIYLRLSWIKAIYVEIPLTSIKYYAVYGFKIEAIVENTGGAGLTGLEIVAIILAVTFLAVVVASIALGIWVTWRVIESLPEALVAPVGIFILILIGIFLLALFGVGFKASKKGVSMKK